MPISTEDRARYPENWSSELVPAILVRAQLRCECMGECGRGHEGVRCPERHLQYSVWGGARHRVILTVAHVNHTPEDGRPEILRAWCQGCHLQYDRDHHDQSRVARLQVGIEAAGQERLFDAGAVGGNGSCPPTGDLDDGEVSQWALPLIDARRREHLQTLSIEQLPDEIRAGLDAAIRAYDEWAAMEPLVRATLAAAVEDARDHGALVGHLVARVARTKPWLTRLRNQWGPRRRTGAAAGPDTQTQEVPDAHT